MVIPVYDSNPVRRTPVVTYLLIVLNVVAFLVSPVATAVLARDASVAQVCQQEAFFEQYAAIPRELTSNEQLATTVGAPVGPTECALVRPSYDKVPFLSVLTAMFLHGGWLHLGGNMLFLFIFGNNVEDRLGRLRFLGFYLLCGYIATYAYAVSMPASVAPTLGASGAIAGVLGAYLLLFPRAKVVSLVPFLFFLPLRLPAWVVLGSWFVLQYVYYRGAAVAQGSQVAYLAHVAGFVVGMLAVLLLRPPPAPPRYRAA